jgi:hypothetical protein
VHREQDSSVDAFEPAAEDPPERWPDARATEARTLRLEVAVLEERLAAAERVVAEREQRIRDLRGSLSIIHAGLMEAQAARAAQVARTLPAADPAAARVEADRSAGDSVGSPRLDEDREEDTEAWGSQLRSLPAEPGED